MFVTIDIQVTNLGYLENRTLGFIKLPDGGTQESNRMLVGLDTAVGITETKNQDLPYLISSKVDWVNKKKLKTERIRKRKINLAQVITAGDTPSSLFTSAHRFLLSFFASTSGAGSSSACGALSSLVTGSGLLFAVSGHLLSLLACDGLLSAVSDCFLYFVASGGLLSVVFGCLLSSIASGNFFFTVSIKKIFYPDLHILGYSDPQIRQIIC